MTATLAAQRRRDLFADLLKRIDDAKFVRMVHAARGTSRKVMWVEVVREGVSSRSEVRIDVALELLAEECRTRGLQVPE